MFESRSECIAKRYRCLCRLSPDLVDLRDDRFSLTQPDTARSAVGRNSTYGHKQPVSPVHSFAAVACVRLFASTARTRKVASTALVALGVTVRGLSAVSTSDASASVVNRRSTAVCQARTEPIAAPAAILTSPSRHTVNPAA